MTFEYLDLGGDDKSEVKEVPRCQWVTIYCPATDKDNPTSVVLAIFHEVCLSMYKLDKGATFLPVEEESDMPELHQDSERVDDMLELGEYFSISNPLSVREKLPLGKDGKKMKRPNLYLSVLIGSKLDLEDAE